MPWDICPVLSGATNPARDKHTSILLTTTERSNLGLSYCILFSVLPKLASISGVWKTAGQYAEHPSRDSSRAHMAARVMWEPVWAVTADGDADVLFFKAQTSCRQSADTQRHKAHITLFDMVQLLCCYAVHFSKKWWNELILDSKYPFAS